MQYFIVVLQDPFPRLRLLAERVIPELIAISPQVR
jgi:hypothetical protein